MTIRESRLCTGNGVGFGPIGEGNPVVGVGPTSCGAEKGHSFVPRSTVTGVFAGRTGLMANPFWGHEFTLEKRALATGLGAGDHSLESRQCLRLLRH